MTRVDSATRSLEGVVILGMHRGGTSLITRLVSLLGLAVCRRDDLFVGRAANPRGHWESKSMLAFNGRLLRELDGTWFCPPLLGPAEVAPMLARHASSALAALKDAHPDRPFVWKDPRTCVLLPFWSAVLEQRVAYVVVVRHPLEVSDSLARRNGCTPLFSLALWERYTRQAILGAAGRSVMVCTYDGVLADPAAWCGRLVRFLSELGLPVRAVDETAVGAFATSGLRHSHQSWTDLQSAPLISPEQVALARAANAFATQTSYVPPALPDETPETESIFEEIREIANQSGGTPRLAALPGHLVTAPAPATDTDQTSRPPVSVIVARDGASIEASILTLGPTLPAGSEILIVGADCANADDWGRRHKVLLRHIHCDHSPSEAEALALGVRASSGRIVLLSTGSLLRCDPWYADVSKALGRPDVGGVGPVMRFNSCPDLRHFGRAFIDEDLDSHFVAGRAAERLVPAALLPDALCAFNREMLAAAGGVDEGFSSARAAVAELSLRLWRMGFRCCIVPHVEVWGEGPDGDYADDDAGRLYDQLRIATLHFSPPRLKAFTDRAGRLPAYDSAAERLAASDVDLRRAAIEAVCAFTLDRYFENFPLRLTTLRRALRRAERLVVDRSPRWRFLAVNKMLKRARDPIAHHIRRN